MVVVAHDPERESRIEDEVLVDTYTPEECAMGWYYYLQDKMQFPFQAQWGSGPSSGESVEVMGLAAEDDCLTDMVVKARYQEGDATDIFSIRLADLEPLEVDGETQEAIEDWQYWLDQGGSLEDFEEEEEEY
jgi:hypothetical protein